MTAKDKAKDLVSRFNFFHDKENKNYILYQNVEESKRCALIAVNELIYETHFEVPNIRQRYWENVKQEIENL